MKLSIPTLILTLVGLVLPGFSAGPAATTRRLATIPAGEFEMGDHHGFTDPKHGGDEVPVHKVRVDAFSIGIHPVTTVQYCAFLNSALDRGSVEVLDGGVFLDGGRELLCETRIMSQHSRIGWDGKRFEVLDEKQDHPVICIRWPGAAAYCNWLSAAQGLPVCYDLSSWACDFNKSGYRLPTEAEWEFAGRGGKHEPYCNFPWGDEPDATRANWPESKNPFRAGPQPWTTPVGFFNGKLQRQSEHDWPAAAETYQTSDGSNGYGVYDMAGNVWELINDWYVRDYYAHGPDQNPAGPDRGSLMPDGKPYRGMRGGSWYNGENGHSRVSNRNPSYWRGPQDPDHPYYHIGFRVVLPADAEKRPAVELTQVPERAGRKPAPAGRPEGDRPSGDREKMRPNDSNRPQSARPPRDGQAGQGGQGGGGGGGRGQGFGRSLLAQALDADQDGTLSTVEMGKAAAALKSLDKNADGKVSTDEVEDADAAAQPARDGRRRPPGGPLMRPLDSDRSGDLSAAEMAAAAAILKAADASKDGTLTREELDGGRGGADRRGGDQRTDRPGDRTAPGAERERSEPATPRADAPRTDRRGGGEQESSNAPAASTGEMRPQARARDGGDGGGKGGGGKSDAHSNLLPKSPNPGQTIGLFKNTPQAFEGYTLFAPKHYTDVYLIDNDGRVVHSWETEYEPGQSVYLQPNGNLLHCCFTKNKGFTRGGEGGRVEEFDWDGNMVWEFTYSSDQYLSHHDIAPMPNGNILLLVVEKKSREDCIAAGFDPRLLRDEQLFPDSLIEVEPTRPKGGKIVWEWHVWDHLIQDCDRSKANYGEVAAQPELIDVNCNGRGAPAFWNHMNSIDYNSQLDQIVMSVRGCNEIWVIDHSTTTEESAGHSGGKQGMGGDLIYRWGNPAAYGRGTAADKQLVQQHDAQWIPPGLPGAGHITIFNNGYDRGWSSIEEIVPPVDAEGRYTLAKGKAYGPEKPLWHYEAPERTDFFSSEISGAHRLPNGNTLICAGVVGNLFEVTPKGETVWQYLNPVVRGGVLAQGGLPGKDMRGHLWNAVFKIHRYAPDYPGLAGRDLTPGKPIEANPTPGLESSDEQPRTGGRPGGGGDRRDRQSRDRERPAR